MPDQLLLSAKTMQRLEEFTGQPAAAILITGPSGSGKTAVARQLAARILDVDVSKLSDYPYFLHVQKPVDKQEISIDAVRKLVKEMRLKPVIDGRGQAKRIIFIEDAGSLSEEAQNALLKTIEEPGTDTGFILTAESEAQLLPTIGSRTQRLSVGPVSSKAAADFFGGSYANELVESAWQLSQGAAGLLKALLSDDHEHPLKQAVDEAKNFLKQDHYHRALRLDSLASDRQRFLEFLNGLNRVLAALHDSAVKTGSSSAQLRKILASRRQVMGAIESLSRNASPRLIGLSLALSLPL